MRSLIENVLLNMKVENKNIMDKKTRYAFKKYDDYLNKIKITTKFFEINSLTLSLKSKIH